MSNTNNLKNSIKVIQTSKDTSDRLTEKQSIAFTWDKDQQESQLINIYDDLEYQEIMGFGGAFTEAGAVTLDKLSKEKRDQIINAYFNPITGIGYSVCRTHINSCDFSVGNYSYDEVSGDKNLDFFDIGHDKESLIPFIKEANAVNGSKLKIFASPWSPPAWMKTNLEMNRGGKLLDEYRQTWADYFVKYIRGYAKLGIEIWGVTVQNEPKAVQRWDSCVYSTEEERDFVKIFLGPTLEREGLGHVKIIIWDHNKERVYDRAKAMFDDLEAAKYIWGIGFHWYSGDHFEGLSAVSKKYPDKKLIFTEGCCEGGDKIGSWRSGEHYGHHIIGDINGGTVAWTDWNMVLDEQGGPNHVGNYCAAPVIVDTKNDFYTFENSYYYIGHFSKFVKPGAKRIGFSRYSDKLEVTAFKNPNGEIVVVVMNRTEAELPFTLRRLDGAIANIKPPAHSIMTLIYGFEHVVEK